MQLLPTPSITTATATTIASIIIVIVTEIAELSIN